MRRLGVALRDRIELLKSPPTTEALVPVRAASPAATSIRDDRSVYVVPLDEPDERPRHVSPVELFASLAEAKAARDDRSDRSSGIGTGLAIGLSVVAVVGLGVMLCYVLFRKKDKELTGPALMPQPQPVPMPYPYPVPQLPGQALPDAAASAKAMSPVKEILDLIKHKHRSAEMGMRTFMRSYTLPYIGDPRSEAIKVAEAGTVAYEVVVRVVQPPGGFAVLAFDPNELNVSGVPFVQTLGTSYSAFPVGNTLIMPAGQFQVLRLAPRQSLYAKGTVAPNVATQTSSDGAVIISVTAADFTADISF